MLKLFQDFLSERKARELLIGFVVTAALVAFYKSREIDTENLALGTQNVSIIERWQEKPFTGYSPPTISSLITGLAHEAHGGERLSYWLWLGNSQLHTINQRKEGDHLAPYWVRERLTCRLCPIPIGISLPNANLQEHLFLDRYVRQHLAIEGIILSLVFDDMREDGVREELTALMNARLETDLKAMPAGAELTDTIRRATKHGEAVQVSATPGTESPFQERLEKVLANGMRQYFPTWNDRTELKSFLLIDLYYTRNWLLNIKPTTVRKMLDGRYERNMRALRDLLNWSTQENQRILVYIAPIRQDLPLPYEMAKYESWKREVEKLTHQYGGAFVNLEKSIPDDLWGSYHADDVDFMHFQGPGHRILAQELFKRLCTQCSSIH